MFDNRLIQTARINAFDGRVLPSSGIISIGNILRYLNIGRVESGINSPPIYDELNPVNTIYRNSLRNIIKTLEHHNIPILKLTPTEQDWLVRLEDLKFTEQPKGPKK